MFFRNRICHVKLFCVVNMKKISVFGYLKKIVLVPSVTILLEGVSHSIKYEAKEQKGGFLSMLLCTLGNSLLGNILAGKGIIIAGYGNKGKRIIRAGYGSKKTFNKL